MNDEMVPPTQIVPDLPPALEEIIMKATNKYQVNRYKSANDMYEALNTMDADRTIALSGFGYGSAGRDATIAMKSVNGSANPAYANSNEENTGDMRKKRRKNQKEGSYQ